MELGVDLTVSITLAKADSSTAPPSVQKCERCGKLAIVGRAVAWDDEWKCFVRVGEKVCLQCLPTACASGVRQ
jgi:hypothetical protein